MRAGTARRTLAEVGGAQPDPPPAAFIREGAGSAVRGHADPAPRVVGPLGRDWPASLVRGDVAPGQEVSERSAGAAK